jgi:uridine kinase
LTKLHSLSNLLLHIHRSPNTPAQLLAIDGHSAAGKSTLAAAIAAHAPAATIIHTDDFYRPMAEDERAALDAAGGYQWYYDWQRLEVQVLAPLRRGEATRYQHYDWASNQLAEWTAVAAAGLIIVEGCYAARPQLRHYYDVIVLVETLPARRAERQRARVNDSPAWIERWEAAERYYFASERPQAYADFILAGE